LSLSFNPSSFSKAVEIVSPFPNQLESFSAR
jgi:hypothetical protein